MPYIHHLLLHFPIVLGSCAAAVALYALLRGRAGLSVAAPVLLVATAAMAILTALSGLLSEEHAIQEGMNEALVGTHETAALVATGLSVAFAVWALLTFRRTGSVPIHFLLPAALLVAGSLGFAAYHGGELTHPGMAPWSEQAHTHEDSTSDHADANSSKGSARDGDSDHHAHPNSPADVEEPGHEDSASGKEDNAHDHGGHAH